jgi:uncharacterized protein (TIGR02117 family)
MIPSPPPALWRRIGGGVAAAVLALAVLLYGYAVAGLIGGAIPANPGWTPPARGIRIYIEDNGIHTGIVLPVVAAGADWRDLLRPGDIADPRYAGNSHAAFGWGERDFYLNTRSWADLKLASVFHAAIGSDATLVHVDRIPEPSVRPGTRSVLLRPEEYRRLAAFIRASFRVGADGRAPSRFGYGAYDAFYDARGRYSALATCNAWTGAALRAAGVRVGVWTPFPVTVMRWF